MFHFLNCVLLTFGPHFILYRSTKLLEENAIGSCWWAGIGYGVTQILRIFVMATFLPSANIDQWSTSQEVLKSLVNVMEVVGAHVTLLLIPNLSKFSHPHRILCVGVGWSFVQSLALYFIPLWIGARGTEFSWEYMLMGVASNVNLLLHMSLFASVWLQSRTDLEGRGAPLVLACLLTHILLPSIVNYLRVVLALPAFEIEVVRAVIATVLAIPMYVLVARYSTHKTRKD